MEIKKAIIIGSVILLLLTITSVAISPFFNTGLEISVSPSGSSIVINGSTYEDKASLDLKRGEYKVVVYKKGYWHKEETIMVKSYGRTEAFISLDKKTSPLIDGLPFTDPLGAFVVTGLYNEFQEPVYRITYFDKIDKKRVQKWFEDNDIDINSAIIEYSSEKETGGESIN